MLKRSSFLSFYSFITRESFGQIISSDELSRGKTSINWVMPPPAPESGGHINMFRFIQGLERRGFDCRVVVCNDAIGNPIDTSTARLFEQVNEWYGKFSGTVHYANDMPPATITMATGWQTAYVVNQFRSTAHKGYFVQDFEPSFYPAGAEACFAEQTYRFGFTGYTAGNWLANKLRSEYGMQTYPISFSYDKELYFKRPLKNPDVTHLMCYVRPLGNLYSQCRAALILSCTNLSLLPLEVMSCGVPVISNKGANTEWLLNDEISMLAELNPASLAEATLKVLDLSDESHHKLVSKGMAFADGTDWEKEFDKLEKALRERVEVYEQVAA